MNIFRYTLPALILLIGAVQFAQANAHDSNEEIADESDENEPELTLEDRLNKLEEQFIAFESDLKVAMVASHPIKNDEEAVSKGRALFMQNCKNCHGANGEGNGPLARALPTKPKDLRSASVKQQTDRQIYEQITNGKAPMPAYGGSLTDEERWDLVYYVKSLSNGSE